MTVSEFIDDYSKFFKVVLPVIMLVILYGWESIAPFFDFRRNRVWHASQNLLLTMMNVVLLSLLMVPVTLRILEFTRTHHYGLLNVIHVSSITKLCMAILLLDCWLYLWHRMNHSIPFLWKFHRMHHADTAMDVTTATRFHLGELILSKLLMFCWIPLLGLELVHLITYEVLIIFNTQIHHANISLGNWDRWLRLVIVSPFMHKIHHSDQPLETNSNYGTVFSFWDRLLGSFVMRKTLTEVVFGLAEFKGDRWTNLWGMLLIPFVRLKTIKQDKEE